MSLVRAQTRVISMSSQALLILLDMIECRLLHARTEHLKFSIIMSRVSIGVRKFSKVLWRHFLWLRAFKWK